MCIRDSCADPGTVRVLNHDRTRSRALSPGCESCLPVVLLPPLLIEIKSVERLLLDALQARQVLTRRRKVRTQVERTAHVHQRLVVPARLGERAAEIVLNVW